MNNSGFDCALCTKLATNARICQKCGLIYCISCLHEICGQQITCIVGCNSNQFGLVEKSALQDSYLEVLSKSQINVPQIKEPVKKLFIPPAPNTIYLNEPCQNYQLCNQNIAANFKAEKVCSSECLLFQQLYPLISQQNYANFRTQVEQFEKSIKEKVIEQPWNQVQLIKQIGYKATQIKFDMCGDGIQLNYQQVILDEEQYIFKTAISSQPIQGGIHYWIIKPMMMTKNEMKIGISTQQRFDFKTAFSDYNFGYAYYTTGQFRNGSNSNGFDYGQKFKNNGTVGVLLDMNKGRLAFTYNDIFLGVAIQSQQISQGPVFPCVALLHCAGFEYQSGIPIPKHILDEFQK